MPEDTNTLNPETVSAADLQAGTGPAAATSTGNGGGEEASSRLIDKGGYTLEYKEFAKDSAAGGFGYFTRQFKTVAAAVEAYGEEKVLAVLNPAITGALRIKAKSSLPDLENAEENKKATEKLLASTGGVLLTEQEAEEFVPGTRGKTSPASLIAEAKAAAKEGRIEEAKKLYQQAQEAMQELALKMFGAETDAATPAGK